MNVTTTVNPKVIPGGAPAIIALTPNKDMIVAQNILPPMRSVLNYKIVFVSLFNLFRHHRWSHSRRANPCSIDSRIKICV